MCSAHVSNAELIVLCLRVSLINVMYGVVSLDAQVTEWKDFVPRLNDKCLCLTPFCDEEEVEEAVKEASRNEALQGDAEDARTSTSVAAKTLCKPYMPQAGLPEVDDIGNHKCFFSGKPAKAWVLWGRSY